MSGLAGRAGMVTGAGRGIGRAIALALAGAGARLLLVSRTRSELEETERMIRNAGGDARILAADVSHENTARRAVEVCHEEFCSDSTNLIRTRICSRNCERRLYWPDYW